MPGHTAKHSSENNVKLRACAAAKTLIQPPLSRC